MGYQINGPEIEMEGPPESPEAPAAFTTDTIAPGMRVWPPAGEAERLERYTRCQRLYEGKHERVYVGRQKGQYTYDWKRPYISVNLCGEITDLMVDRLFGEMPRITAPPMATAALLGSSAAPRGAMATATEDGIGQTATTTAGEGMDGGRIRRSAPPDGEAGGVGETRSPVDEWIDRLVTRSKLHSLLIKVATGTSYRGDGALRVRWEEKRGVTITSVSPRYLFLDTAADDTDTIIQATIGYIRWQEKEPFLFLEIHTPGHIAYELYRLHTSSGSSNYSYDPSDDRVALATFEDLAEYPDEQETGIDDLLIIPIALGADDEGGVHGRSDYADIDGLQGELNNRVTQRSEVLDKVADPWMFGPPSIPDENGKIKQGERYIQLEQGESAPGYLIWDSAMQAVKEEIADLISEIILTAGLSPESFQLSGEGAAESGRALKLRQFRTASAVQMRQIVYGEALPQTVSVASKLAANHGEPGAVALEPEDVLIVWQDSMPADQFELVQTASIEVDSGLASRRTSIRRLHPEMTDAEIDEEMAEIDSERRAAEPAAPSIGLGAGIGAINSGAQAGQPASSAISNRDRENVVAQGGAQTTVGNPQAAPRGGGS